MVVLELPGSGRETRGAGGPSDPRFPRAGGSCRTGSGPGPRVSVSLTRHAASQWQVSVTSLIPRAEGSGRGAGLAAVTPTTSGPQPLHFLPGGSRGAVGGPGWCWFASPRKQPCTPARGFPASPSSSRIGPFSPWPKASPLPAPGCSTNRSITDAPLACHPLVLV